MLDLLVEWYGAYGIAVVLLVVVGAAVALPLPASLLLITAGALAERSGAELAPLILGGIAAAAVGDQVAYHLGRSLRETGGRRLPVGRLRAALHLTRSRGMWGVFLTRWLFAPLAPAVSYASGMLYFPRTRFAVASLLGEVVWVTGYVGLGTVLGRPLGRVSTVAVGAPWVAAVCAVIALAAVPPVRRLVRHRRRSVAPVATMPE